MRNSFLIFILKIAALSINRISWRFGRPRRCQFTNHDHLKVALKPGMVLLTHRNHELSNFFIRGYWTHAALIISSEEIIEAVSSGVEKRRLEEVLTSADDFAILAPRFAGMHLMMQAAQIASDCIGSPYSFGFYNNRCEYYCSGLIYTSYLNAIDPKKSAPGMYRAFKDFLSGKIIRPNQLYENEVDWKLVNC